MVLVHRRDVVRPAGLGGHSARPALSLSQTWTIVLPVLFAAFLLRNQVGFVDLGYHLRAGDWAIDHLRWLDRDIFTHTFAGDPWLNQNWLAQVFLVGTYRASGLTGLVVVNAALFTAGFVLLYGVCRQRTGETRAAAIAMVIASLPSIYNTAIRPQSFSWLLMVIVLAVLERSSTKPRRLWVLPPLFALWANLHGAFAVGLGFLVIESVCTRRREDALRSLALWRITGLSALAVLVNPWGWRVYGYVFDVGSDPTIRNSIEEWQPPRLTEVAGALFLLSVALVVLAIAVSGRRLEVRDLVRLGFAALLGFLAIRNGLWWTVAAAPTLATLITPLGQRFRRAGEGTTIINLGFIAAALVILILASPWLRDGSPLIPDRERSLITSDTPVEAVRYLRTHDLQGEMLNTQGLGSFLEFAVPADPVFIDSRIEMFPDGLWADYSALMSADPGWEDIMTDYDIGYALLDRRPHVPLLDALDRSPHWRLAHGDRQAAIYLRVPDS